MSLLEGKVAVVTGAGSGIGRAGAELMARAGATVVVADLDEEAGQAVVTGITTSGGTAIFVPLDVCQTASVQAMVTRTVDQYGRIDVLFHNAMSVPLINHEDRRITELPEETWDKIIGLVLSGTFLCTKYVGRQMLAQRSGSIVLTATVDALVAVPGFDGYIAAKGGVIALTRSAATGLGREGVRVNAVCPSFVTTPHQMGYLDDPAQRAEIDAMHLLPVAEASDIAEFALYLASDKARCITGGVFPVDSGYTAFKAGDWLKDIVSG